MLIPALEAHAAKRLQQRYGLDMTEAIRAEINTHIAAAQQQGGQYELAVRLETQHSGRERWLVSAGGVVLHAVICPAPILVTFLPRNSNGYR